MAILTIAAVALRIVAWHGRGDLWLDEAWLALNVVDRDFAELLSPLAENQSAPLLWLWVTKALTLLPLPANLTLRSPAFLAGVALVPGTVWLATRVMRRDFALASGGLVAASPLLVRYSVEAKPYMLDALVAIGLALLLARLPEQPGDHRRWRTLAAVIVIAPLASITAVFVVPGIILSAWALQPVRRHPRAMRWLAGSAVASAGLAATQYLMMFRSTSTADFMQGTWAGRFLPAAPGALLGGLWSSLGELMGATALGVADEALPWLPAVLLALALAGALAATRRRGDLAIQAAVPLAAAAVASVLHQWPMHPRLLLFVAPWLLLLMACALDQAGARLGNRLGQLASFAAIVIIAVGGTVSAVLPPIPTHLRRVVAELESAPEPPDVAWFDRKMIPACEFYTSAPGQRRCVIRGVSRLVIGDWIGPSDMGQFGVRRVPGDAIDWAVRERARIDSAGGRVTWAAVAPPDRRVAVLARIAEDAFDVDTVLFTRGAVILRLRRR